MKVSIVIPVYNTEKYLERCIVSVINQTYNNLEIIIINDYSQDNSLKIIHKYQYDSRIILINNSRNYGISYTRNKGILNTTGEYIIFLDSDDWLEENAIELLLEKAKNFDFVIPYHSIIINNSVKNIYNYNNINQKELFFEKSLSGEYPGFVWGRLYKTHLIKDNNLFFNVEVDIGEDLLFNLAYLKYIDNIGILDKSIINYSCLPDTLSRKYHRDLYQKCKLLFNEKEKVILFQDKYEKYNQLNLSAFLNHIVWSVKQELSQSEERLYKKIRSAYKIVKDSIAIKNVSALKSSQFLYNRIDKVSYYLLKKEFYFLFILIYILYYKKIEYRNRKQRG